MEVVASLSQGHTAAAQCGLFTHISVPVIFEPPCNIFQKSVSSAFLVHTVSTDFKSLQMISINYSFSCFCLFLLVLLHMVYYFSFTFLYNTMPKVL